ncbi:MAG TPA: 2-nitropropane dioxygenase, partial [Firmicutes bacterium]|nr:2-nitropropane dioxygenase [Bacillota bacterium]
GTDRSVKEILPEVLQATNLPVIAAGGIMDGFDAAEVIKMGAAGVQMATRFVTSTECEADDNFKKMYLTASQDDVVLIKSPVGMPGRALRNKFTELLQRADSHPLIEKCRQCLKRCSAEYCIMDVL